MTTAPAAPSNATLIAKFFEKRPGDTLADLMGEIKALTTEDKVQLGEGIRSGSLTY